MQQAKHSDLTAEDVRIIKQTMLRMFLHAADQMSEETDVSSRVTDELARAFMQGVEEELDKPK